jgi:AbrB family looped-hinge helix DNA binding protein
MNIGNIVTPNTKGQIVIPQKMRGGLGITSDTPLHLSLTGDAIMIRPIRSIITNNDTHVARAEVLKNTAGSWIGDDWPKTEKKRKQIELAETKKRKTMSW